MGASSDILATGHEFLPVGGYTGELSTPTLAQFIRYVAEDRVRFVNVATRPFTRSPDLRWAAAHCRKVSSYYAGVERTTFTDFSCVPMDATRPAAHAPVDAPFTSVSVSAQRGSR